MRRILVLTLLFALSCNGSDYSITDSLTQTVTAKETRFIEIVCHCPNGVDVTTSKDKVIQIDIKGSLGSVGYHGEQIVPEGIGEATLSFKVEESNDTLRLISKEWTYMHHAYIIERLKVTIPFGTKYTLKNIPAEELEGGK